MNAAVIIVVIFAVFVAGVAFGFIVGLGKGMSLAVHFRSGRPLSPIPWMLCFIGASLMILTAAGSAIRTTYFLSRSVQVEGQVIKVIERTDQEGPPSRFPVYRYTDAAGVSHEERSSMSDGREYEAGDKIPVRYLRTSPQESRIDDFSHHWFLPLFMAAGSAFLTALGFGLRWWRAREQRWANQKMGENLPATALSEDR